MRLVKKIKIVIFLLIGILTFKLYKFGKVISEIPNDISIRFEIMKWKYRNWKLKKWCKPVVNTAVASFTIEGNID